MAIHATLVGIRGILAQGAGMLLYRMTGSFALPFAVAALAFAWASWQMWRLHGIMRSASKKKPDSIDRESPASALRV